MNRRGFLLTTGALLVASVSRLGATPPVPRKYWTAFSCRTDQQGGHYVSAVDQSGRTLFNQPLPGRGHGLCLTPDQTGLAVFARRPGDYILILDVSTGQQRARIKSPASRHFYGHGVYSQDGSRLYVTENDFETGKGFIAVYDSKQNYHRMGEMPSFGIGPHELALLADDNTLVVANGGIKTHPDFGRAKLNLDSMVSSLSYIDVDSGKLLGDYRLDKKYQQLSLRHLAVTAQDQVCVAMQFQGPANQHPPLIAMHQGQDSLTLSAAPKTILGRMKNYCGSVALDASGEYFAVSSPRGGLTTIWHASTGAYHDHFDMPDVCGLAPGVATGAFVASSGQGEVRTHQSNGQLTKVAQSSTWSWDNHMVLSANTHSI